MRGITKAFGPLVANDHIDLIIEPGQIHALLGENGAGKSTAMKAVFGMLTLREGRVTLGGADI
ncbi:ATP-binding cassette domain-containing protein, partial [Cutibacterium acnes subsp. acnes]|nr:ATP-binding cassette domain-containing protein [Cutibacterium acnes subsp. acnes]